MNSTQDQVRVSSDKESITEDGRCTMLLNVTRLRDLLFRPTFLKPAYPSVSSIPRTCPDRLSAPDASPSRFPDEPIPATSLQSTYTPPGGPPTVLYLAYGSNLCAQTFLGQRGIRPISQVNVSCPTLDLTFDLPGIPYIEPCFANTAPRKVPKTPPKLPPDLPKPPPNIPDIPTPTPPVPSPPNPPPPIKWDEDKSPEFPQDGSRKEPAWEKGLIGVVYEVTKSDYAHIVATEGGGLGYKDILVPCLPLPASVGVPERPPEIPIPFLAHTLFAPQIPDTPDNDDDNKTTTPSQLENQSKSLLPRGDDDDDDKPSPKPPTHPDLPKLISKLPPALQKLFLPKSRAKSHPFEPYAQPSARYLSLLVTGAFEHDLPQDYQKYLASLQPYTITTFGQGIAKYLVLIFLVPVMFFIMFIGQKFFTDPKTGNLPLWFGLVMNLFGNLTWGGYGLLGKKLWGDGERTIEDEDDDDDSTNGVAKSWGKEKGLDTEKQSLLAQNMLLRDW
ncbi:putative gliotoxin biosynthesis protein [Rhypophila decipiens]